MTSTQLFKICTMQTYISRENKQAVGPGDHQEWVLTGHCGVGYETSGLLVQEITKNGTSLVFVLR